MESQCLSCKRLFEETSAFPNGLCEPCDAARVASAFADIAAREKAHRIKSWPMYGLPFADTDRDRLPASKSAFVLKWRPAPGQASGLVLMGASGLGKTRTAIELIHDVFIESGCPFEFCRMTEWRLRLDKAHRYGGKGVADLVRPLCRTPFLVADDLCHGKFTENSLSSLFEIIDCRTSRGLPTVFTTQFSKDEIQKRLSAVNVETTKAIFRRLEQFFRLVPFVKKELEHREELALL